MKVRGEEVGGERWRRGRGRKTEGARGPPRRTEKLGALLGSG